MIDRTQPFRQGGLRGRQGVNGIKPGGYECDQ